MQKLSHQVFSFSEFTLDRRRGCLLRAQEEIKLRPKSFEVLNYLVENNGRLISKDELIHAVWVEAAVTDDSLVQCMKDIRHALSDETQQIIKTVHGRTAQSTYHSLQTSLTRRLSSGLQLLAS